MAELGRGGGFEPRIHVVDYARPLRTPLGGLAIPIELLRIRAGKIGLVSSAAARRWIHSLVGRCAGRHNVGGSGPRRVVGIESSHRHGEELRRGGRPEKYQDAPYRG